MRTVLKIVRHKYGLVRASATPMIALSQSEVWYVVRVEMGFAPPVRILPALLPMSEHFRLRVLTWKPVRRVRKTVVRAVEMGSVVMAKAT